MHLKYARINGERDGELLVQEVRPGRKVTAEGLMPVVHSFLEKLEPDPAYTYVLVNAMGYSEFYGSNSNTDWYGYNPHLEFNGLLNTPPGFGMDVEKDRMQSKDWPYGYPTFYGATAYAHHKNDNPQELGFGDVILSVANPRMKRIELVKRIFNEEAIKKGHESILNRIRAGERVDVSMGCKVPFDLCVDPYSLVRTREGHVKAKEVKLGDEVWTHRGRFRKVTRLFRRESDGDVMDLRVYGAPPLRLSAAHPMYVVRGAQLRACLGGANGKRRRCTPGIDGVCQFCEKPVKLTPEWVAATDIRPGDYIVSPRAAQGDIGPGKSFARLLGYYLGDGSRLRQRTGKKKDGDYRLMGLSFSVGALEQEHYDRLIRTIEECDPQNAPNTYSAGMGRMAVTVTVYDQELAARVVRLGGNDCYTKRLHEDVFSWNREALIELLAGWIDTDGHSDPKKGGSVRVCSVSRGLVLDFQRACYSLGIPASISATNKGGAWFLSIPGTVLHSCPELAVASEKVRAVNAHAPDQRSSSRAVVLSDSVLRPVREIRRIADPITFVNFSVEEDESYVVEGLSSHNCSICTDWDKVKKAWGTYDATKHRHPGIAILAYHKMVEPIRGLAITSKDYCPCMLTMKGKILPDGRKVFVYNDFPRFFDISFVWIGADRTARVMWHLMPDTMPTVTGPRATPQQDPMTALLEVAARLLAQKKTAGQKLSEIVKEVPDGFAQAVMTRAESENYLSPAMLAELSQGSGATALLSSLAALGIVVQPEEFAAIIAPHSPEVMEHLSQSKLLPQVPTNLGGLDDTFCVNPADCKTELLKKAALVAPTRSSFAPFLMKRASAGVSLSKIAELKTQKIASSPANGPLSAKLASQYNAYRASVLEHAPSLVGSGSPYLELADRELGNKIAGGTELALLLLGLAPVVHLIASHLQQKRDAGSELGAVAGLIADNPSFTTVSTIGAGLRAAMRIERVGGILPAAKALFTIAKNVV